MTHTQKAIEQGKKQFGDGVYDLVENSEYSLKDAYSASLDVFTQQLLRAFVEDEREALKSLRRSPPQPVLGMGGDMTSLFERLNAYNEALSDHAKHLDELEKGLLKK